MNNVCIVKCQLSGVRPLMFDRYSGDNNTQLPVQEKMYLTQDRHLMFPAINLYSLLTSQNDSVIKRFFGKQGSTIGLGIKSYTMVSPFEIPICDDAGPIKFEDWSEQISIHRATARVKKGTLCIPQPKERPLLALPWHIDFEVTYQDNKYCSIENLRQSFEMGGIIGLGTFRPFFGRYEVALWKV